MAETAGLKDVGAVAGDKSSSINAALRSRPVSTERDSQVRATKAILQSRLGPYEPLLTYLQSVLVWEKPLQCLLLCLLVNVVFWFFALASLRLFFLLASGLLVVICVETWRNKIWPKLRVRNQDESESESWGLVQPGILSVPELCHHIAEAWVSVLVLVSNVMHFKRFNPGKFCILISCLFFSLAVIGCYVPGLALSYSVVLAALLAPLAAYYRVFQRVFVKLEPGLQRLDFSVYGYMMSKPLDNQFLRMPLCGVVTDEDSEEELAAFWPAFDDVVVAKELTLTDSEHSDAEISYTENGTFNLSRGQTPLTEGSEDLDRHSDAEESFAQDLPDFPSINPEATILDDDDDTSIGLPSLQSHRASVLDMDSHLESDQEDLDAEMSLSGLPPATNFASNLAGDIAGDIASNMIRAALIGAMVPQHPSAQHRRAPPRAGACRRPRKQSSSELDTDFDVEDFEMLDQSELSQMDPIGEGKHRESQGSNLISSLLGKSAVKK
ncbi:reticulophagy regulator 3 isoform X2 [Stigmatopora argus]